MCLQAIRAFYEQRDGLGKMMADICKEEGFSANVCALTASTGLSLAESVSRHESDTSTLVGPATTFFSYSWTGTALGDMLASIERKVRALEATDGKTRYVWVDMFAASQNLLAGRFLPKDEAACSALKREHFAEYAACKEDTDHIFDGALAAVDELLLYCSPLTGKWLAPKHAFLLPDRGDEPPVGWTRTGPGAMTRAWCMFELASALALCPRQGLQPARRPQPIGRRRLRGAADPAVWGDCEPHRRAGCQGRTSLQDRRPGVHPRAGGKARGWARWRHHLRVRVSA